MTTSDYMKGFKCVLSVFSGYHKHYKDTVFEITSVDGHMVNLIYNKHGSKSGICVPADDIAIKADCIRKCPFCGGQTYHYTGDKNTKAIDKMVCFGCDAEIEADHEPFSSIPKWNKRVLL